MYINYVDEMYINYVNEKLKFIYEGSDSIFLAISTHVCGQMEILKMEFVNYGVESKNIFDDFSILASRHHYLIEHAELLVEVISFVLLVQIMFSCLIICLIGK